MPGRGVSASRVVSTPGGYLLRGVSAPRRGVPGPGGYLVETPPTAIAVGGTHPTGMYSC